MQFEPGRQAMEFRSTAYLLSILAVLLCLTGVYPQGRPRVFSEPIAIKAAPGSHYDWERWRFSLGSDSYEIDKTGRARRQRGRSRPARFRLGLAGSDHIVRIYYAPYKGDLILLCEDEAGGYGSGSISRFDGQTLKQKWRVPIPAFNVANGLIEGKSAYLGAIGFAAKLDLDSGKFIWMHDDFYRKYREDGAFNIFETPTIVGNEVVYVESQDMYRRPPNIIKLNKNNGKVVKVELN
jgi:hypothetical protein